MGFFDKFKSGASKSWDAVRDAAEDAAEFASDKTESAIASLAKNGHYSKDDFCKAYIAAGVLMAAADGDIAANEVEKISRFLDAHPITSAVSASKRQKYLDKAVEQAELGMLNVLADQVFNMMNPLFDEKGDVRTDLPDGAQAELENKAKAVIKLAVTIKDEDATVTDGEFEMLEGIVWWLAQDAETFGQRADLRENKPQIVIDLGF